MIHKLPVFALLLLSITLADSRQCYWPDGSSSPDIPCSDDEVAPCCNAKNLCLSNKLCMNVGVKPFALARGGCTDPNWSSGCPSLCSNVSQHGAITIGSLDGNEYCCGDAAVNGTQATCPHYTVRVPDGHLVPGFAALANVSSLNARPSTKDNSNSHREVAIGAGVGVPLGVIALAAIAWALWERRRWRQLAAGSVSAPPPVPPPAPPAFVPDRSEYAQSSYTDTLQSKHQLQPQLQTPQTSSVPAELNSTETTHELQ